MQNDSINIELFTQALNGCNKFEHVVIISDSPTNEYHGLTFECTVDQTRYPNDMVFRYHLDFYNRIRVVESTSRHDDKIQTYRTRFEYSSMPDLLMLIN